MLYRMPSRPTPQRTKALTDPFDMLLCRIAAHTNHAKYHVDNLFHRNKQT